MFEEPGPTVGNTSPRDFCLQYSSKVFITASMVLITFYVPRAQLASVVRFVAMGVRNLSGRRA